MSLGAAGWYDVLDLAAARSGRYVVEPEGVSAGVGAAVGSGVEVVGCTRAKP
jgi:hypothetical protein